MKSTTKPKPQSLNGYKFDVMEDARGFLDASIEYLQEREDLNATVIATADLISSGSTAFTAPFWFGTIRDRNSAIAGCAIHCCPDGLTVTGMDSVLAEPIYRWVRESAVVPNRVTSEPEFADSISALWLENDGKTVALEHHHNIYRLDSPIRAAASADGFLRFARKDEASLVREWGAWYSQEKPAFLNIGTFFQRKLDQGELLVWDDDGPTTIMTLSAKTKSGIRISGLYTPLQFRGKGYASALVAEVCSQQFTLGRAFITLSAQKDDPVERMYQRLGFYRIGERKSITYRK